MSVTKRPRRITVLHQSEDEDPNPGRGRYVGTTSDGRRFFITTPFCWAISKTEFAGRDYVALYLWSADGEFESASIDQVAHREPGSPLPGNTLPAKAYEDGFRRMLDTLGAVTNCDIRVAPFAFELSGVTFGLVARAPKEDEEDWTVTAEPGNYMCWYPPWDGEYDT
jgi:hypothetical protein